MGFCWVHAHFDGVESYLDLYDLAVIHPFAPFFHRILPLPAGAGKTTTLSMLSGDVLPSSGDARLAGYDILTQQPEVRRLLGYCPQFDALLELMTTKE